MDRRNGAIAANDRRHGRPAPASRRRWTRLHSWLIAARARDEDDRRRELTLNWLLLLSIALAGLEAGIRVPDVIQGGAGASDHAATLVVACGAGAIFTGLLVLSRRGKQVHAAWGLLCGYYALAAWLFVAEGVEETAAIMLCAMVVVAGGVLLGSRVSAAAVLLLTTTLITVAALESAGVLHAGDKAGDVVDQFGIGGALGALALVLSARTSERRGSVGELLSGGNGRSPDLPEELIATLTVREVQVVRLVAAGRSNDEIARELFVSPRTVHTHVSNSLRKTGCANRTELAVLAIQDGAAQPPPRAPHALRISTDVR